MSYWTSVSRQEATCIRLLSHNQRENHFKVLVKVKTVLEMQEMKRQEPLDTLNITDHSSFAYTQTFLFILLKLTVSVYFFGRQIRLQHVFHGIREKVGK